jgi:hypothetical protein
MFLTANLLLDCQFCFPVDIVPESMIIPLPTVTSYPAPFDQNPEDPGKAAFGSEPIIVCGYLQTNQLRDLFEGFGFSLAIRKGSKHYFMGYDTDQMFVLLSQDK